MAVLEEIYNNILALSTKEVAKGVNTALDEGIPAAEILGKGLIAAMEEVGRRFEEGDFFVPEMLAAAQAMRAGVEILRPKLVEAAVKPIGKVVIVGGTRFVTGIGSLCLWRFGSQRSPPKALPLIWEPPP